MTQGPNAPVQPPQGAAPTPVPDNTSGIFGKPPYLGPPPTKDDQTMGMLCHLLGIFTGFIGPLVIWLMKKDTSPFVDDQGKEALNWHITLVIGIAISIPLTIVVIGAFMLLGLAICNLIFCIMGTIKANEGVAYRYPFALRLLK